MIEILLTKLVDHQVMTLGALMIVAVLACFTTYKKTFFAVTWFVLPVAWILLMTFVGTTGVTEKPREYCQQEGGLSHFALAPWPKKSYAVCKDRVDEDFEGKTYILRTKGVFGTPISKLPKIAG